MKDKKKVRSDVELPDVSHDESQKLIPKLKDKYRSYWDIDLPEDEINKDASID